MARLLTGKSAEGGAPLYYCGKNSWWCDQSLETSNASNLSSTPGSVQCASDETFALPSPVTLLTQLPLTAQAATPSSVHSTTTTPGSTSTIQPSPSRSSDQILASLSTSGPAQDDNKTSRDLAIGLGVPLGVLGLSLILLLVYKLRRSSRARYHGSYAKDDVTERHAVRGHNRAAPVAENVKSRMPPISKTLYEKDGQDLAEAP